MVTRAQIWTFPLRGRGLLVFLAGVLLIVAANGLASISVPMIPAILATFTGLYTCAFAYLVVRDTARGENTIATWPGLPHREVFFAPVGRVLVGALWGCLPALLYRLFVEEPIWIFWGLFLLGVFFIPMVLVRVATRESFLAGQPMAVLICILRTLREYPTACVPYYLAVFGTAFAATVLSPKDMWIEATLAYSVSLYLILVEFFLLGLFHRRNARKLHLSPFPLPEEAPETPAAEPTASPAGPTPAPADDPGEATPGPGPTRES